MDRRGGKESSVVDIVHKLLLEGINQRASDIFIEPQEGELQIRFRIDGLLHKFISLPFEMHSKIVSRIKIMGSLDIAEHRLPQDGSFKLKFSNKEVDFRISTMPSYLGEKVVLRILDRERFILDIDKLGIDSRSVKLLKEALAHPHGMVLICGPSGCGKTTTLYACIKYVDSVEKNIVTVEDPIEYQLYGINQVQVKEAYGLNFASVLRSVLRQDPDVIIVGEIRDSETAEIAIRAALTGHLVLSSLHTTTSTGSLIRLINMGIDSYLIGSSLLFVGSQALIRLLCSECKEPYDLPFALLSQIEQAGYPKESIPNKIYRSKGCSKCNKSGYFGRIAIMESLFLTPKIREMLEANISEREIRAEARKEGMRTLRGNAFDLLIKGVTSMEEIARVTGREEAG
ncbi:MAG: hypothetical protein DRP76_00795 [Candidatus Omnitrophota bacterium]|nr:MAG: hypothetical protein DRP61_04680 [Candidatus Omnitrophota bacterium]RKY40985.1 MAG: hypothetical protein DRP76_00795 [Candidatus Omnitrophota bacterium]RKY43399.1 MAG: hypothetical protein DRP80_05375 [Candidatus Omnitrophota bacterium]HEC68998.1 type II/IV secretion system protein [Candidatus Omnitrophota bacterium]